LGAEDKYEISNHIENHQETSLTGTEHHQNSTKNRTGKIQEKVNDCSWKNLIYLGDCLCISNLPQLSRHSLPTS
jgi:hypothetical protein